MRAAALPRCRGRQREAWTDSEERLHEGLDDQAAASGRGVHPAEVPDAVQARRQGVLKESADKGVAGERADAGLLGVGINILKTDPAGTVVRVKHLTVTSECGSKHITGEILQSGLTGTGRLAVHNPGVAPHRRGDRGMDFRVGRTQALLHAGAKPCGEYLDGQEKIGPAGAAPRTVIGSQSASRNNVMEVGMHPERPVPGMINPEEPQFRAEVAGMGGDLLECGGTFVEQGIEEPFGLVPGEQSQRFGDREGHQKVRYRQQTVELVFEPGVGVGTPAAWTQTVVAAVETKDFPAAIGARAAVPAHRRGATSQHCDEGPALGGWQAATMAGEIVGAVASEQLSQGGHYAPSRGLTKALIVAKALSSLTAVRWV